MLKYFILSIDINILNVVKRERKISHIKRFLDPVVVLNNLNWNYFVSLSAPWEKKVIGLLVAYLSLEIHLIFFIYKNFLMFYSRIKFHFEPNPYLENDVLIKELHLGNPREYYFHFVSLLFFLKIRVMNSLWTITHDIFNIQFNLIKSALFNLSVRVTQTSFGKKCIDFYCFIKCKQLIFSNQQKTS